MNWHEVRKISVVGNSGAGKSTLSIDLGRSLGLNVFLIDKIYWLPAWKLRNRSSFKDAHDKWLKQDTWIIDGVGYWEEMEARISESDIVIFMDIPVSVCKQRAKARIEEENISPNPNVTVGCVYNEVKELQMKVIDEFQANLRPNLLECLSKYDSGKVKVICSYDELNIEHNQKINTDPQD